MSRGFVNEDDQEEIPFVPPRADLPAAVTNYVTQFGLDALLDEKQKLINEKEQIDITNEKEKRITTNYINAKLKLLNERILTAVVIDLSKQPQNEVRFGSFITLKIGDDTRLQRYQIVGVDEADISKGKISFISPIARILTDKKLGDKAVLKLVNAERVFEIMEISH
ncbi:GreA/GreB family elongation factor [Flavobacterium frigoris]|uniref:Transcription elongation factor GreB n=1 Tax=Flavobacterium frigoris (strain PS1) TaxID=1086011 RepID=H7FVG1_FLAFP|nr:GreA/GreB family elongation factor [Flavobacterium frigoris]EIA07494.1 transcription elongation factor GreB [Flavobacterium frigoris PS1]